MNDPNDILQTHGRGMRYLFRQNERVMRLFFTMFDEKGDFYVGSSLKKIHSAGLSHVGTTNFNNRHFPINIDTNLQEDEFKSLKFSFHSSGVRHLKCRDRNNDVVELFREKYKPLNQIAEPELLFCMISKKIKLYDDFNGKRTRDNMNAVILNTPIQFSNCRNLFELFISTTLEKEIPEFLIKIEGNECRLPPIKLEENLFLHIRYSISAPETNELNSKYQDREILIFKDNSNNDYRHFSFR